MTAVGARRISIATLLVVALSPAGLQARQPLGPVAGFTPAGKAASYDRRTVWQAINGAAELYMAYGFKRLHQRSYRARGRKITVEVQLYELASPVDAFGVFWRERPDGASEVEIGAGGAFAAPYQCLAHRGRFYLKAQPTAGKLDRARCVGLLRGIARRLPGKAGPPPELALLPRRGQKPGSARFTGRSFLGIKQLRRCLHATYRGPGKGEHVRFVMLPPPGGSVRAAWKRMLAAGWDAGKLGELPLLSKAIPYKGTVAVVLAADRGAIFGAARVGRLAATRAALEALLGRAR